MSYVSLVGLMTCHDVVDEEHGRDFARGKSNRCAGCHRQGQERSRHRYRQARKPQGLCFSSAGCETGHQLR